MGLSSGGTITGAPAYEGNTATVSHGQSLIGNWDGTGSWTDAGKVAYQDSLDTLNSGYTNIFIDGAEGGSYLSKRAYDAAGGTNGEYHVIDTDADSANWTRGPEMDDLYANIITAGKTNDDINIVVISNLQADGPRMASGAVSVEHIAAVQRWAIDDMKSEFPNLVVTLIAPMGRRTAGSDDNGFQEAREAHRIVVDTTPGVFFTPENIDIVMQDETGITDDVHRSDAGNEIEADRVAHCAAFHLGQYSGNYRGAICTNISRAGATFTLTFANSKAPSLANSAGTSYTGTPIDITPSGSVGAFSVRTSDGAEIPITSVHITGLWEVTIVTDFAPIASVTVHHLYSVSTGIDLDSILWDDATYPLPACSFSYDVEVDLDLDAIDDTNLVAFFSAEADPNSPTSPLYYNNSAASSADMWTKRAGSISGNAYRDGTKPGGVWYANSNLGLDVPGVYFNSASTSNKLLVQNLMTTSSDVTVIAILSPEYTATDPTTGSALNAAFSFGGVGNNATLAGIAQTGATPGQLRWYAKGGGSTFSPTLTSYGPHSVVIRRNGNSGYGYLNGEASSANPLNVAGNTAVVDDTNSNGTGTPLFAIGNATDKPTGADTANGFIGAIHALLVFDADITEAYALHIAFAVKQQFS